MTDEQVERAAIALLRIFPGWQGRRWEEIGEETRALFRQDATAIVQAAQSPATAVGAESLVRGHARHRPPSR